MDYFGYHLANCYGDLTPEQALFIQLGRAKLHQEMNEVKKGKGGNLRGLKHY